MYLTFCIVEIYDRKMCCELKNNDSKQVSTYKPLLNRNSLIKSHFLQELCVVKCLKMTINWSRVIDKGETFKASI